MSVDQARKKERGELLIPSLINKNELGIFLFELSHQNNSEK